MEKGGGGGGTGFQGHILGERAPPAVPISSVPNELHASSCFTTKLRLTP